MSLAALPSLNKNRKITSTSVLYVVFFFCVKESREKHETNIGFKRTDLSCITKS